MNLSTLDKTIEFLLKKYPEGNIAVITSFVPEDAIVTHVSSVARTADSLFAVIKREEARLRGRVLYITPYVLYPSITANAVIVDGIRETLEHYKDQFLPPPFLFGDHAIYARHKENGHFFPWKF